MKKILLTSAIILLILIPTVGILVILLSPNESSEQEALQENAGSQVVFPPSTPAVPVENQTETISVKSIDNQTLSIRNITSSPEAVNVGENIYSISGESFTEVKSYSLLFNQEAASFAISLESLPLNSARDVASEDFLRLLNISIDEACNLNVYVGVSVAVSVTFAGQNLGLSYCSNAVEL